MTLVLTVNGPETMWALADRRLSHLGRVVKDDAHKMMFLETVDGQAILVYAGLGATSRGTQPADWMSAVLRGRNLSMEQSLGVLADAMKREFPRHLSRIQGATPPAHNLLATAFVDGEHRFYTIDLVYGQDLKQLFFRYTRHLSQAKPQGIRLTPAISVGGTGGEILLRDRYWVRPLRRVLKAYDRGQLSPFIVADHLAGINQQVYDRSGGTVGPRCIVAWRHTMNGIRKGGGGHACVSSVKRDSDSPGLPTICRGMDVNAIVGVMMPHFMKSMRSDLGRQSVEIDQNEVNAELAQLPEAPDEALS